MPVSAQAPVWSEAYCGGAWLLSRYDDVATALRHPHFSVRRATRWINSSMASGQRTPDTASAQFKRVFARSLLFLDGRVHRRLRAMLHPGFKAARLQQQAAVIAALAADRINALQAAAHAGAEIDFISHVARPLPALVIAGLLGLPALVPDAFIDWAARLADFIGSATPDAQQTLAAQQALVEMCAFFETTMAHPEAIHRGGLLTDILQAQQTQRLTRTAALAQCCTLLFAGYETTRNLLGNGLLALLRHPAQWQALQARPQHLRSAVREMLRYDSPVQYTGRRLLQDVELGGQYLRRGQLAILHIGAANHDPRRFSDPGRFDIMRDEGPHLSFGHGPHVCLGAALTQLEAELAFTALLQALPAIRLGNTAPQWQNNAAYRALQCLPIISGELPHA